MAMGPRYSQQGKLEDWVGEEELFRSKDLEGESRTCAGTSGKKFASAEKGAKWDELRGGEYEGESGLTNRG